VEPPAEAPLSCYKKARLNKGRGSDYSGSGIRERIMSIEAHKVYTSLAGLLERKFSSRTTEKRCGLY
jgi:hypothetical protein